MWYNKVINLKGDAEMQNFELYNPVRVIFGSGESKNVGKYAAALGSRALVISYEEHGFFTDLLTAVEASLREAGISVFTYYHMQANPLLSHIREAVALCRKENIDFCVGVGGGSVMDATKVVAAGTLYDSDPWNMFVTHQDRAVGVPPTKTLPTVMIPTLPATSSEMNCIAVVTNDETKEKTYVSTPVIFPKISIVDPALTCTLPRFQTVSGAMDAMSHIFEAYFSGDRNSPLQDRLHEGLLVTIMSELRAILADPQNVEHRANMQWAATLAWNGYIQSGLNAGTPMHAMGHVLSALYNTTHGVTLSIFMDAFFRYMCTINEECEAKFATFGRNVMGVNGEGRSDREVAVEAVERFIAFMDEVGAPHTLSAAGIPTEDIEKIADNIVEHGCDANGNLASIPPIGRDAILEILHMAE